jgi:rod shape-determining protein MreD
VVLVLFFALRCPVLEGAIGSAVVGYLVDILSGQPSGLYVFTAVLTFLFSKFIAPLAEVRSTTAFALLAGCLDVLHNMTAFALVRLSGQRGVSYLSMLWAIFASAGLTLLAGWLIWPLLKKIDVLFKKPDIEFPHPLKPKKGWQAWRSRRNWTKNEF